MAYIDIVPFTSIYRNKVRGHKIISGVTNGGHRIPAEPLGVHELVSHVVLRYLFD